MELIIAVIGILGVVVGGGVQHFATTRNERWKYKVEMRTDAYKALMDAIANLSILNGYLASQGVTRPTPEQAERILAIQTQMTAAKTKVALYGSPRVLREASEFFSAHAAMKDNQDVEAFIDVVAAMRDDSYAESYPEFRQHFDNITLRGMLKA